MVPQRLELFPDDPKLVGSIPAGFLNCSYKFRIEGTQALTELLKAT